jgi:hypothetical protein
MASGVPCGKLPHMRITAGACSTYVMRLLGGVSDTTSLFADENEFMPIL